MFPLVASRDDHAAGGQVAVAQVDTEQHVTRVLVLGEGIPSGAATTRPEVESCHGASVAGIALDPGPVRLLVGARQPARTVVVARTPREARVILTGACDLLVVAVEPNA